MRKLIAVAAMVLSTTAVAQPDKDWWACQVVKSSGMEWENNRWVTGTFQEDPPFVLMSDGNGSLTKESVSKVFSGQTSYADQVTCNPDPYGRRRVHCFESAGTTMFFDSQAGKGAVARVLGSISTDTDRRDSVEVSAFECTKG